MQITLTRYGRDWATLTTEHSASSHEVPVLVVDGEAYGPDDTIPEPAGSPIKFIRGERAAVAVLGCAIIAQENGTDTHEYQEACLAFAASSPRRDVHYAMQEMWGRIAL